MADTVKKFRITGEAAKSLMGEGKTRKKVKLQKGGAVGAPVQVTRSFEPSFTPLPTPAPVVEPPKPIQDGGKRVQVILDKSKSKTRKIILSPPKKVIKLPSGPEAVSAAASSATAAAAKKFPAKTHKVARRIRVSVDGLKNRVNRAKTIKKESQALSIDKVKKDLEKAGLIKAESKAPEMILRQMYIDFQVLKQRAL
jgi:hypothetical protein